MVGGIMHYFPSMTWDEIMNKRSYANIMMLMATIPTYEEQKEDEEGIESKEDFADLFKK